MWDKSQITEDISEASNLKLKDYLFNKVYTTGILSEQWKGSKIVPTFNKTGLYSGLIQLKPFCTRTSWTVQTVNNQT